MTRIFIFICLMILHLALLAQMPIRSNDQGNETQSKNKEENSKRKTTQWEVAEIDGFSMDIAKFFRTDSIMKHGNSWYFHFEKEEIKLVDFFKTFKTVLGLSEHDNFKEYRTDTDGLGLIHHRFQQFYDSIEVEGGELLFHEKDGYLKSVNGLFYNNINSSLTNNSFSDDELVKLTIEQFNSNLKDVDSIQNIKSIDTSYIKVLRNRFAHSYSDGKMHYVRVCELFYGNGYNFYFEINSKKYLKAIPLSHNINGTGQTIYNGTKNLDTEYKNGKYYLEDNTRKIYTYDLNGNSFLKFPLAKSITNSSNVWSQKYGIDSIRLISIKNGWKNYFENDKPDIYFQIIGEDGSEITSYTYDDIILPKTFNLNDFDFLLNVQFYKIYIFETDYVNAELIDSFTFTSNSSNFNFNRNNTIGTIVKSYKGNPAIDAHWGMQKTFDYFKNVHGRNSYDNYGSSIKNYVNWYENRSQATWNGSLERMFYGNGDNEITRPFVTLDIIAHEFTHGVVQSTAKLKYENESGALNESFADIFGVSVAFATIGSSASWYIGKGLYFISPNAAMRSFENPSVIYWPGTPQPKFYEDSLWHPANYGTFTSFQLSESNDYGGVHTNSGVQNFWYYLLCHGGSGTNYEGNSYNVTGVGITNGSRIAYRNLTYYLTSNANYENSCYGSLNAAIDSFGVSSQEAVSVIHAWYAVGLTNSGSAYCSGIKNFTQDSLVFEDGSGSNRNYQNNNDCRWLIKPNGATAIYLSFSSFDVATDDTLIIYNGNTINSTILAKYTGTSLPSSVTSTQGAMLLRFVTNSSSMAAGWIAKYRRTNATGTASYCTSTKILNSYSGTFTDESGSANYQNNANCKFKIAPPGATSISLSFNNFNTELKHDSVTIYDGDNDTCSILGHYSGSSLPFSLTSTYGKVLVKFVSDNDTTYSGWSISYTATGTAFCSGLTTYTNQSDTIKDGSGPGNNYQNNIDCFKRIKLSSNRFIKLVFDSFNFEQSSHDGRTIYDYLEIFDGDSADSELIGKFYGTEIPDDIYSTGNSLYIVFHTDNATTAKGFQCHYTSFIGPYCSGTQTLSSSNGTITDGSGSNLYGKNSDCRKLIQVSNATSIELQFTNLRTDTNEGIIVYDGSTSNAPVLAIVTGNTIPQKIVSTYGTMLVRFVSDDTTAVLLDSGFSAIYTANISNDGDAAIVGYEFWYDNDSDRSFVKTTSLNSFTLNTELPTTGLIPGLHSLHIRLLDREGQWSSVISELFQKISTDTVDIDKIIAYEYWYDTKNNQHTFSSVTPQQTLIVNQNFQTDSLEQGLHSFHIRFKNGTGQWSSVLSDYFIKNLDTADSKISFYEYWFDTLYNSKITSTLSFPIVTYILDSAINALQLTKGRHVFHSRFESLNGYWSTVTTDTFIKKGVFLVDTLLNPTCANDSLKIKFTKWGIYTSGNTFSIQLSDSAGNFSSPITIGIKANNQSGGSDSIICFMPANTKQSSLYKIRVLSSNESDTSNTSNSFIVNSPPPASITLSGSRNFCDGDSVVLSANVGTNFKYQWYKNSSISNYDTLQTIKVKTSGIYKIKVTNSNGCYNFSNDTAVTVFSRAKVGFTLNSYSQCLNSNSFVLNDTSTISTGSLTRLWSFGDGNTSTLSNPIKVYSSYGTFNIKLVITSNNGCKDSLQKTITVLPMPKIGFTINNNSQCLNANTFAFNDTTNTSLVSYSRLWDFGDGTTSTLQNPNKTYSIAGTYSIKLRITTITGCIDSIIKTATVFPLPLIGFTTSNVYQCINTNNFNFNDTTSNSIVTHTRIWDFGDGTNSSIQNPSKSFTQSGNFTIKLVITTANGCKDSIQKVVTVFALPKIGFTVNNSNQCSTNNNFIFNDTSNTSIVGYSRLWNFGDGNTSTLSNPSNSYAIPGSYDVKLVINTANGCKDSVQNTVNVYSQPHIGFTINNSIQCLNNNSFSFTDTTNSSIVNFSRIWYIGTITTSTLVSPNFTFTTAGTYNIKLVITTVNGCKDSVQKTVTVYPQPQLGFTINNSNQCLNTNIFTFIDTTNTLSVGYSRLWDFGDGTYSTFQFFLKKYSSPGTYNVKLKITTSNGCIDSVSKVVTIYPTPIAGFTINSSNQCFNTNSFSFTDTTSSNAVSHTRLWEFGDGTNSTLANPTKTYSMAGSYFVKLKITTANGCVDSSYNTVIVYPIPLVGFTINNSSQCFNSNTFNFLDTTNSNFVGYSRIWDFGDGVTSTFQNFTKSYANPGIYTVKLKIITSNGCLDSVQKTVTVYPKMVLGYEYTKIGCDYGYIFNDTSKNISLRLWRFGDGSTDTSKNVTKSYSLPGIYSVSLKLTDNNGCSDSIVKTISIIGKPQLGFKLINPNQCLKGNLFIISDTSMGLYNSREWSWSDGKKSILVSDTHTFSNPGSYSIKLKVIYGLGCSDSIIKNIEVYSQPIAIITSNKNSTCLGDSILLSANSASKYLWSTNDTSQNIYVKGSGTYSLRITNTNSCADTISKTVIFHPLPPIPVITFWGFNNGLHSSAKKNNQWYLNDTLIPGATDTILIALKNGSYKVGVIDSNGCTSFSLPRIHNINGIIKSGSNSTINAYPNPNDGSFTIEGIAKNTSLKIFDSNSKRVEFVRNQNRILLVNASKGMYYIQIFDVDVYLGIIKIIVQ